MKTALAAQRPGPTPGGSADPEAARQTRRRRACAPAPAAALPPRQPAEQRLDGPAVAPRTANALSRSLGN